MASWERALLKRLGYKPTRQNIKFLQNWQRWEGGHTNNDARFNWLNTTKSAPGAVRSINSVGVKAFDTFEHGIDALASTLNNGRYGDILEGLSSGNPYKFNLNSGLSTWVSGSPTGNLSYAQKVMGGKVGGAVPKATPTPRAGGGTTRKGVPHGVPDFSPPDFSALNSIFADDPEFLSMLEMVQQDTISSLQQAFEAQRGRTANKGTRQKKGKGTRTPQVAGGVFVPPINQQGTHVTDNLDWNNGAKTAKDYIMAAGTPVGAPESGKILRWGSAQGGESLYFQADSGHLYWLGHIDNRLPEGTRVKKGQVIAYISADHVTPHLHIDRKR